MDEKLCRCVSGQARTADVGHKPLVKLIGLHAFSNVRAEEVQTC